MGSGSIRNTSCSCGSGKKYKHCCGKNKNSIKEGDILPLEGGGFLHLLKIRSNDGYDQYGENGFWYSNIASVEEVGRIIKLQNIDDYLLKMRADSIIENMRLYRTFLKRRKNSELLKKTWSLESHFSSDLFKHYLSLIEESYSKDLIGIKAGFIYCNEPNGMLLKTDFGNLVLISESFRQCLFFMNLYMLDFEDDIPFDIRFSALKIAIRIMLTKEALDFELDSRGTIPERVLQKIRINLRYQILFIIGHEYAHQILQHLGDNTINTAINLNDKNKYIVYNHSQENEFDADIQSIKMIKKDVPRRLVFHNSLAFFTALSLYEHASEQISPSISYYLTHPKAIERLERLIEYYPELSDNNVVELKNYHKNFISDTIKILQEDVAVNFESYETYGSIYLGKWKEKALIDRIDY